MRGRSLTLAVMVLVAVAELAAVPVLAQEPSYYVYVASESADEVSLLEFTPGRGIRVAKVIPVGFWPAEMEGPHGINMDPAGTHWYLTLGHGFPFGSLLKYRTVVDTLEGHVGLGLFPATLVAEPGGFAFVVNSNFHGEHEPSSVSVVDLATMTELERIETCTMPHGSRLSPDGTRHYSACMIDDRLVEIDATGLEVRRTLDVGLVGGASAGRCSPTWAAPSPDGRHVYVPCNKRDEVLEVDIEQWQVTRRFDSPKAPYNAEVTPDGARLVVTQKGSGEVSVWDLAAGRRIALIPSTRKVTHGVTITPDGRYAFISVEGIGGEPGAVDVIDLASLEKVASVDVGKQAGGIVFWRALYAVR
jgi:DNA-binding beta-propeller fold protein YncE